MIRWIKAGRMFDTDTYKQLGRHEVEIQDNAKLQIYTIIYDQRSKEYPYGLVIYMDKTFSTPEETKAFFDSLKTEQQISDIINLDREDLHNGNMPRSGFDYRMGALYR